MKVLNIGGLKIKLPIIQGGMGVGVSLSELELFLRRELDSSTRIILPIIWRTVSMD